MIPKAHAELGDRMMVQQGSCGLDFEGGPGNCGAVAPKRPFDGHFMLVEWVDTDRALPTDEAGGDEGESLSLLDLVRRRKGTPLVQRQPEVTG